MGYRNSAASGWSTVLLMVRSLPPDMAAGLPAAMAAAIDNVGLLSTERPMLDDEGNTPPLPARCAGLSAPARFSSRLPFPAPTCPADGCGRNPAAAGLPARVP